MRAAFKNGYQVKIHLIGDDNRIIGEVVDPATDYVIVRESKSGKEVCVNYSAITHVYPNVERPEKKIVAPEAGPVTRKPDF